MGKITLSIHAAWFFAERYRTPVLDLDQQANLSYTLEGYLGSVDAVQQRAGQSASHLPAERRDIPGGV